MEHNKKNVRDSVIIHRESAAISFEDLQDCVFYLDIHSNGDKLYVINPIQRTNRTLYKKVITGIMGGRVNIAAVTIEYNPTKPYIYKNSSRVAVLNTYKPPQCKEEEFWNVDKNTLESITPQSVVPKINKNYSDWELMPKIYMNFFMHLGSYEADSIEYIIDWLSVAVDGSQRNTTALTLIGGQGSGKSTFIECILTPLFGEDNIAIARQDELNSRFNAFSKGKQLIAFEELNLKDTDAVGRFKQLANETISVEQKGVDTFNVKNWANIILISNNLNSINPEIGDRRFSILEVTNNRLETHLEKEGFSNTPEYREALKDPEQIALLYKWLIEHKPNRTMSYPFVSANKGAEVKEASLKNWETGLLEYLSEQFRMNNKKVSMRDITTYLELEFKIKVGRERLKNLEKKYPQNFILKRGTNNNWFFEVLSEFISIADKDIEVDETYVEKNILNNITSLRKGI